MGEKDGSLQWNNQQPFRNGEYLGLGRVAHLKNSRTIVPFPCRMLVCYIKITALSTEGPKSGAILSP